MLYLVSIICAKLGAAILPSLCCSAHHCCASVDLDAACNPGCHYFRHPSFIWQLLCSFDRRLTQAVFIAIQLIAPNLIALQQLCTSSKCSCLRLIPTSGTYTVVPSLFTRALEIGLSHISHMLLQPTTSADGGITLFAVCHQHFSHSIEIHLPSAIRSVYNHCLPGERSSLGTCICNPIYTE